jgi:hypothetical protein
MNSEVALDDKPFHVEHSGLTFRSQTKLFAEIGPCDDMFHVEHKIQPSNSARRVLSELRNRMQHLVREPMFHVEQGRDGREDSLKIKSNENCSTWNARNPASEGSQDASQ